jgi:hypothetical protein
MTLLRWSSHRQLQLFLWIGCCIRNYKIIIIIMVNAKGFLTRHGCCLQSQSNFGPAFPAAFAAKGNLAGLSWGFKPVAAVCSGVEST